MAVLMMDGWQVRQRGLGWGKKKTQKKRVEWHEWKSGVFYRLEQAGVTAGGRGILAEKTVVGWQGQAIELGQRLQELADKHGEIFPPQRKPTGASAQPGNASTHRRRGR